jgi:hypothetical protein
MFTWPRWARSQEIGLGKSKKLRPHSVVRHSQLQGEIGRVDQSVLALLDRYCDLRPIAVTQQDLRVAPNPLSGRSSEAHRGALLISGIGDLEN